MTNKGSKFTLFLSISAIVISLVSVYINWWSFVFNNRPYIRIAPVKFESTGQFYSFEKINGNFRLDFKFRLENIGRAPANDIRVKGVIYAFLKDFRKKTIEDENLKKYLKDMEDADFRDFKPLDGTKTEDRVITELMEELRSKDILMRKVPRTWKRISLFPSDSFEFIQSTLISGKDAKWFMENFNKLKMFRLELKVFYWGVLPKIGRPYYSNCTISFEKNKLLPFESESY
ncbi:MAG: hypothetical protein Q8O13_10720 [Candidatus Omnitrophota bacterium]|nr:hypothetical protein [Candidatus Omnitrophota bacterium]